MAIIDTEHAQSKEIIIASAGDDKVSLPWAGEALTADFLRSGPDLVIISESGEKIIVEDYFLNLQLKDIFTAGGAKIPGNVVYQLSGNPYPGAYAQSGDSTSGAGQPIGVITLVQGIVRIKRSDGTEDAVEAGAPIYEGDVVETKENAAVGIEFEDKTTLYNTSNNFIKHLQKIDYRNLHRAYSHDLSLLSVQQNLETLPTCS